MAAAVSGFLGFAISKVVDQFWTPLSICDQRSEVDDVVSVAVECAAAAAEPVKATPAKRQNAATRRANRRKNSVVKTVVAVELPIAKARAYSDADPVELASNASTCGSSDDEDDAEVEDIGAKEMRLMMERAQEIKRLTKQSRQQRQKETRARAQAAKAKDTPVAATAAPARFPDVRAPIRLQNTTNALWNWSVYSGFVVDTKVSNRGPRNMRHLFCAAAAAEQLESEELLLSLAAQVLAEN